VGGACLILFAVFRVLIFLYNLCVWSDHIILMATRGYRELEDHQGQALTGRRGPRGLARFQLSMRLKHYRIDVSSE